MPFDTRNVPEAQLLQLLARPRNRAIVTVLDEADRPLHVSDLADRLVTRDTPLLRSATYDDEIERALISLHHHRLPELDEAGLIEYDRDANTARIEDTTAGEAEWIDVETIADHAERVKRGHVTDEKTIGLIEGRETVIEYGRCLADEADEELFCMYVSDDLLEEECIRRAESAIDRGVDIYLGSQNPSVRDLTRKHLPEATIWEPQLDWMNPPSMYPAVGRLVFADREKVMLAVLEEPNGEKRSSERAMIGEGESNPLVVLVRELLGPRLDHLDYQSEDFRGTLPF